MAKLLIIDDDLDICKLLDRFLTRNGYEIVTAYTGKNALELLLQHSFDLVFCDFRLTDMEGREFIEKAHEKNPYLKIVIITGYSDVRVAVDVIKKGALDYVIKPLIPDEVLNLIKRCLTQKVEPAVANNIDNNKITTTTAHAQTANNKHYINTSFVKGTSAAAKKMYDDIKLVAPTNFSVIIYGESGAGKENTARSIHQQSNRANEPFVAIDCGALTKELAGSELWGHEKGAFTGAVNAKPGQFEIANKGTIFLDEIANLSYEVQVGLLRLVQERKLRRVGGVKDVDIDVRIIVASNENLLEAVQKGKFREDLYYRFNEFNVNVPALREMPQDIIKFANHFLQTANHELEKNIEGFDDEVKKTLADYTWPGNLREMRNIVRRAALLTDSNFIGITALPQEIIYYKKFIAGSSFAQPQQTTTVIAQQTVNSMIVASNITTNNEPAYETRDLKSAAQVAEAEVIKNVLNEVKYNRTKAAEKLGIDRKTLFNKMKQYNL